MFHLFPPPPEQPRWLYYSLSSSSSLISFLHSSWYISSCLFCLWASFPCSCPTWGSVPSCCFPVKINILWMRMFPRFASTCALSQPIGELETFSAAANRRQSFLSSLCHQDNLCCPLLGLQICALFGEINARGFVVFHSPCPYSLTMIILRKTILHKLHFSGY